MNKKLIHQLLNICLENGLSFETRDLVYRVYTVSHFDVKNKRFLFFKESSINDLTLEELKQEVLEYLKTDNK